VHTLANPGDPIQAAQGVGVVNMEGELAAVIGKRAACLTAENALDHVLGYTVVNDVTNADQGSIDEKLFQVKAGVNYTPLGPWIETEIEDPENVSTVAATSVPVRPRAGARD
jgi:2-keto-4-pentenoate hydratase/2-oxohepta-3-ene-1,7-dioic acid hydratase in catechol pathway